MPDSSGEKISAKSAKLIEQMRAARHGNLARTWEYVAKHDPDFAADYEKLYERSLLYENVPAEGKTLGPRYREYLAIALLCTQGNIPRIVPHIRRAFRHGATRAEMLEALEACIAPGGTPTFVNGVAALMLFEEEERAKGNSVP